MAVMSPDPGVPLEEPPRHEFEELMPPAGFERCVQVSAFGTRSDFNDDAEPLWLCATTEGHPLLSEVLVALESGKAWLERQHKAARSVANRQVHGRPQAWVELTNAWHRRRNPCRWYCVAVTVDDLDLLGAPGYVNLAVLTEELGLRLFQAVADGLLSLLPVPWDLRVARPL